MSGKHRGPRYRPVRDALFGLWLLIAVRPRVTRRIARRVYGARPTEINGLVALTFPAAISAAESYNRRCTDCGRSPEGCARWHYGYAPV